MKTFSMICILLMTAVFSFGQNPPKNTLVVSGVYGRSNIDINDIKSEPISHNPARDAVGPEVTWHYAPTKGPLIIGMSVGVLLHNREVSGIYPCGIGCTVVQTGTSKVSKAYFQYEIGVQDRKGNIQPGLVGVVGLGRSNFDGVSSGPGGIIRVGEGTQYYAGGKVFVDLNLHKQKIFLRTALQVTKNFSSDTSRFDAQGSVGLAIKW